MSKRKTPPRKAPNTPASADAASSRTPAASASPLARHIPSRAAVRETIESVAIAFVLAFLFRTFEAEAFVIPTGSMAPTLMGRHKDLHCSKCDYPYQVSASNEINQQTGVELEGRAVSSCTCPMCRYTMDLGRDNPQHETYPSFKGDRILVSKVAYHYSEPDRWDVVVFKYPGDAQINFIKRLVGKPNETIRISHGRIFVKDDSKDQENRGGDAGKEDADKGSADRPVQDGFHIARKAPSKLLAMLQPVFDNDYMPQIVKQGWQPRWRPWPTVDGSTAGAWQSSDNYSTYQTDGTAASEVWLHYQHRVPSFEQWQQALRQSGPRDGEEVAPQLISDVCAYDTGRDANGTPINPWTTAGMGAPPEPESLGLHWVSDLALGSTIEVQSDKGKVVFELVRGGRQFQCRIDVATGQATLGISGDDVQQYHPTAITSVRGRGKHEIIFSNCDDELLLWVDGSVVQFDRPTGYPPLGNTLPSKLDLEQPAGVASADAALHVSHLKLSHDIYYIAVRGRSNRVAMSDFLAEFPPPGYLSNPRLWDVFRQMREVEFPLKTDQFLVLGDNSAQSKDSRLWEAEGFNYYVKRELLIGKAFFIYWPHALDWPSFLPDIVRFVPNVARMGFVR